MPKLFGRHQSCYCAPYTCPSCHQHNKVLSVAAVPIYVQHYLGIAASGASWHQILAAAMHSRIRAVQQQSLPPAVVLASCKPPPLLPSVHPACRLASTPGAATPSSNANATEPANQLTPAKGSITHNARVHWQLLQLSWLTELHMQLQRIPAEDLGMLIPLRHMRMF